MRINARPVLRTMAAVVALAAVVGVPATIVHVVGEPWPSAAQWRSVWSEHQVDSGFVVRCGSMIVSLMWVWFVGTAFAEAVQLVIRPAVGAHVSDEATTREASSGPSRWIRRWVRYIALSSVAATGSVVMIGGGLGHRAEHPTPGTSAAAVPTVPTNSTSVAVPLADSSSAGSNSPVMAELAGLSILAAGVVLVVQRLRRRRLRAAPHGARVPPPSLEQARFEVMLGSTTPVERIARLDHSIRIASAQLDGSGESIVGARLAPDGTIALRMSQRIEPATGPWYSAADANEWVLAASAALPVLADVGVGCSCPTPLLVPIGVDREGWECLVDLGAIELLVIDSPASAAILRSMAASLALSPFMDHGTVITVGLDDVPTDDRPIERCASFAVAASRARAVTDEPVVVVASVGTSEQRDVDGVAIQRREAAKRCFPYGAATNLGESRHRLVAAGDHHVLEPWGWVVAPPSVSGETLEAVQAVLDDARRPLDRLAPVVPIEASSAVRFVEPEWRLLVRLLGQVEVVTADGVSVAFDRSKALELVVWLALHRERPTRSKARAALWDTAVTAATFSNVVSDARRAMARMMPPPPDSEWIARTMTEDLSLHPLVISDADVLAARVDAARRLPSFEAVEVLRPGLELVSGLPFESSCYAWPDAEGHTSSLVLLATDAAAELAGHYLSLADIDGVFWATGQGLKVLSGHEALIAMRMRAHASRGDRSGVRHEWESYERALAADSWSAADPSPKLVALRAELLSSEVWPTSSRAAGA